MHDKVLAGTVALLLAVAGSGGAPQLAQAQSSSPAMAETAAMVAAMKPGEFRAVGKNTMRDVVPHLCNTDPRPSTAPSRARSPSCRPGAAPRSTPSATCCW